MLLTSPTAKSWHCAERMSAHLTKWQKQAVGFLQYFLAYHTVSGAAGVTAPTSCQELCYWLGLKTIKSWKLLYFDYWVCRGRAMNGQAGDQETTTSGCYRDNLYYAEQIAQAVQQTPYFTFWSKETFLPPEQKLADSENNLHFIEQCCPFPVWWLDFLAAPQASLYLQYFIGRSLPDLFFGLG